MNMSDGFNDLPCCALLRSLVAKATSAALSLSPSACLLGPANTVHVSLRVSTHVPTIRTYFSALPCSSFD